MSDGYSILVSLGVCIIAAGLEGVCAGKNVKSFFATLRFPPYSAPLWVWSIIGVFYYAIFCFVLYRLLRLYGGYVLKYAALTLICFMMIVNALTNYIIFRARNLRLSFVVGALFPIMDIALFICLIQLDKVAAWSLAPYLIYRIYAVWWGYSLWKINNPA
jgi:tryptophan-rich sensory protein